MMCVVCRNDGAVMLSTGLIVHPQCFKGLRDYHIDAIFGRPGRNQHNRSEW